MSHAPHIDPTASIGSDSTLRSLCYVGPGASIGNRVLIGEGAHIAAGCRIEDDVVIGPGAVLLNGEDGVEAVHISRGSRVGGGAVLSGPVRVHRGAKVADGAVVTRDVPAQAVVSGNPARIVGYVGTQGRPGTLTAPAPDDPQAVRGVRLVPLKRAVDLRGSLVAANFDDDLPFIPKRVFAVFDVPSRDVRGEHAHRRCEQLLIALKGSITCVVSDGVRTQEFVLDRPDVGLHMPPMLWGTQYNYSQDSLLLVLASHEYDPDDYIRSYDDFLVEAGIEA